MNPTDFIQKHITEALAGEGFPTEVARGGAEHGVDYYRRCSQSSRKGSMFEDCLFHARQWVLGQTTKAERRAKKKPGRGAPPGQF
ncbi:hypothetical protein GN543_004990 [Salmonella enterica]|nr:hypothetical protein [Salmonella enterica]